MVVGVVAKTLVRTKLVIKETTGEVSMLKQKKAQLIVTRIVEVLLLYE